MLRTSFLVNEYIMPQLGRRKKLALTTIVLVIMLLEVYAHGYIPLHELTVVPENQTKITRENVTGNYTFIQSNSHWIAKWVIDKPTSSSSYNGYVFVWIFKTKEEPIFLSSGTGILISEITIEPQPHGFDVVYDSKQDVLYENNRTDVRIQLHFGENGTYQTNLYINVKFYRRTLIGITPTGEQKIPINTMLSVFRTP